MTATLGEALRGHAWHGAVRRRVARAMAAILSAAIALPSEAASCHHYSRWYYHFPQRCGVARQGTILDKISRGSVPRAVPNQERSKNKADTAEIPLPSLARTDCVGGAADEPTRARILLRAALEAANAH